MTVIGDLHRIKGHSGPCSFACPSGNITPIGIAPCSNGSVHLRMGVQEPLAGDQEPSAWHVLEMLPV